MIAGSVDVLAFDHARGWAANLDKPTEKVTVRVMRGEKEIARCVAKLQRSDLVQFGDDGKLAYELHFPLADDVASLKVIAECGSESSELNVINRYELKRGYQTFEDQLGDSNSLEKLKKLGIPDRFDGLSVLDLGCNEGFFCIHAQERGAARVTGIDASSEYIARARKRNAKINYIEGSWWNIPPEKYDYIFFLSAMHYEANPQGLFDKIALHLNPGGKLIVECGIINVYENKGWATCPRGDGVFRYPSRSFLINSLLRQYYVRYHGPSVEQDGDAVPRHVFHASLREPVVVLLSGKINSGKTILASLLEKQGSVINFSIDAWLWQIKYTPLPLPADKAIYKLIRERCQLEKIDDFIGSLSNGQAQEFAMAVFAALPLEADCVIVEGYALGHKEFGPRIRELLQKAKIRTWQLERI